MRRWRRRLFDRIAPTRRLEHYSTLDGEPFTHPYRWTAQLNGPSYTEPRIRGTLIYGFRVRRFLFGRIGLRTRSEIHGIWIDGLDPSATLLAKPVATTGQEAVREYLRSWGDASWNPPDNDEYVDSVVTRMATLRTEHPDGEFPTPAHGQDDIGACAECDALRILQQLDDAIESVKER